ncbi:cag pathogenicity island Cag12 family protein [Campylobacter lanienae]|uniref:cag pathogenicity island Cag12 family protein n=1 Tax=Campylobacter lanienae TaxID=75658 RepID=UPI00242F7F4D|nr:cag pathogenicity island Cag12 family protein [Campylobacter lanienae]
MKKITMLCLAAGLAFVGCSAPKAVELDSGANITLNHNLIQKRHFGIQKDEFLRYNNWVYNIVLYKNADDLIPNEKIVKTFYLAHNADRIIIIGDKNLAYEYRNYFFANEVKAKIEIQEMDFLNKNKVNILFFHKKEEKENI